ncbi:SpoIIE family protein phosphatase [Catenulispora yoronensis]|uniref:SpoIIE family protein phosphatase n=1 Tax=Catenulispora yoronensis TaxID=450799 RepID=A0ABN2TJZ2_9ACTN
MSVPLDDDRLLHDASDDDYRILLVEDDGGDALLVREMLADTGLRHTLLWATTLADALKLLRGGRTDCVLLDLNLPDASGLPFMRAVQAADPDAAIIVLTGMAEFGSGVPAMANGAQDYLVKGQVDADMLQRALRYAVNRKHAERANAELIEKRVRAEENVRLERGLLPAPLLTSSAVTATTRYLPSREQALLGGDFLDIVETADGIVHAIIGDVCGHGPDEAALGVCLRIAWRTLVLAGHRDVELLDLLEQVLVAERSRPEVFATCATISIDLAAASATLFLAGHHEPLLMTAEKAEPVSARHGAALGLAPGQRIWHPSVIDLADANALLLYTDGLIEGHDGPGRRRLGEAGLVDIIATAPALAASPFLDHLITVVRTLDAGRHADDIAMLHIAWDHAVQRGGAGNGPVRAAGASHRRTAGASIEHRVRSGGRP